MEKLSIRAYAKIIGVSEGAIRKAIEKGKFQYGWDQESKKINPIEASQNPWVQDQQTPSVKPGQNKEKVIARIEDNNVGPPFPAIDLDGMDTDQLLQAIVITSNMPASTAMRYREIVGLAMEKNKLAKEAGALVDKVAVDKALFNFGSELRKALLNIPVRIARDVMLADNEVSAINIITNAITTVLIEYASWGDTNN